MSFDSDDYDSVPLLDISELDFSLYDRLPPPSQNPPPPPPALPLPPPPAALLPADDDDAEYWSDLPIRVDEDGNYVTVAAADEAGGEEEEEPWVEEVKGRGTTSMEVDELRDETRAESSKMGASRAAGAGAGGLAASQFELPPEMGDPAREGDLIRGRVLEEAMRVKQDLERQVNELKEAALIAKGESANLRRAINDTKLAHDKRIDELTKEKEAALVSVRKKQVELSQAEEARAVKRALDDHQTSVSHGVPGSAARRNPTFGPTQSVNRSHSKHPQQQQQQQWSQASHSQQTPAPLRQKGVPLGMTGMGGGFSQKFGAGGGGSPMVLGSVKGKGKAREVSERPQLPPVPKFPNLNNSFAVTSKRSKTPHPPPQPNNSRTSTSRSPSKAPPAAPSTPSRREAFTVSRSSRSPSKPTTNSPLSNKHLADSLSSQPQADHPGSPFGRKNKTRPHTSDESPSPSKRTKTMTKNLGEGEGEEEYVYPEDGGLGMEVDYEEEEEGDRTINGVERFLDGDAGGMEEEEEEGEEGEGEEQEEEEMEEEVWVRDEKDLLFSTIFSHISSPLSTTPSRSSPSQSIQIILAPLPPSSSVKDKEDHARCCGRIMAGLSGSGAGVGVDLVYEVVRGLNGVAKVFERLKMLPCLTTTLKLLLTLTVHIPRAARSLLHLQSFPSLLASIADHLFPDPPLPVVSSKHSRSKAGVVVIDVTEAGELRDEKEKCVNAMVDLVEVVVWEAREEEKDLLIILVELPKFVSGLLATPQPSKVVLQTVRILVYLSLHESLFRPLFSFPDVLADPTDPDPPPPRDPTRIPLVETLCRYLRDPHPAATPEETVVLSLDILSFFRTLIDKHQDDVVLLLSQSRSVIPTLVVSLEHHSSLIWGVSISPELLRLSIPPLLSSLHLLSLLTRPTPASNNALNLADKLRQAPRAEFNAAWERFLVAFGRICYAEVPDLKEIFWEKDEQGLLGLGEGANGGAVGGGKGEREGAVWEGELERAGEIARDIFDLVIEGPEGDLVYAIFDTDANDNDDDLQAHEAAVLQNNRSLQTETVVIDDSETEDEEMPEGEEQEEPGEVEIEEPAPKRVALGGGGGKNSKSTTKQEIIELSDDDD
ncbi:hypothetical protein BDY24DRAFT_411187 [Mrakia frigida]|uniref:uncharacterized protein n=1 Tax=Mrakia frigida TaxID=29902 RepID=UPI003FCC1BBC